MGARSSHTYRGSESSSTSPTTPGISQVAPGDCGSSQMHVSSPTVLPTVSVTEGGPELPSAILEVQSTEAVPMRVLPVAESPASVEVSQVGWSAARQDLRQGPGEDCGGLSSSMPSRDHLEVRHQCLPGDGPLCEMRKDPEAGEDQAWRGSGPAEEEHHQDQGHRDVGVRAVPCLEAIPGGASRSLEASGVSLIDSDKMHESGGMATMSKREMKLQRQARASLQRAETMWKDLMTLVGDSCVYSGDFSIDHLQTTGAKTSAAQRCKKSEKQRMNALGLGGRKNLVSEVFNPNRFQKESIKQKFDHGRAFDITLGTNLLKSQDRNGVRHYVGTNKPGLVVVSPPCTLYSALQNLNQKHLDSPEKIQEYLKRMTEAQVLMRFATEICRLVASYGGTFLFEQPQTSRAWKEPFVEKLTKELQNFVVTCDQCMFDLRSAEGFLHKKPTSWLTNNEHVASVLRVRCDQGHKHQPLWFDRVLVDL